MFSFIFQLQTTPGYILPEGQCYAAELCCIWGLHLQATKYAITAVYSNLKVGKNVFSWHA